ncbi:competence/damage-inducible protein A [Puteibacter caeruleilacunae]|nr:competence/damage-inducible protein A [Puteibacter caeruleilacunae]
MNASIINIGDELLIGQVINTNASKMAAMLNSIGVWVNEITTIADKEMEIRHALDYALLKSDVVLLTGGLGPTKDDITKKVLLKYFGGTMIEDAEVLEHVHKLLEGRGIKVGELNTAQALVPSSCKVLFNKRGTAPGMWFEQDDKIVVSMPGVPFEMEGIMEKDVIPALQQSNGNQVIIHKTVLTQGLPESMLAERIEEWESKLPEYISLAYLPSPMAVRLRLSGKGKNNEDLQKEIEKLINELHTYIGDYIFGYDDDTLASVIGEMMIERNTTLATAESCTGGNIGHQLTMIPGSSAYFKGGIIAYSNEVKQQQLQVDPDLIEKHGAVSQEVVEAMAKGAVKVLGTDFAVATSGIAGPDGGTEEKPVGTVWIAVASKEAVFSKKYQFGKNRERNITRSTQTGLNMLRRWILK